MTATSRSDVVGRVPAEPGSGAVVALSLATTVVGSFPLFLTGALAVQMRADIGFSVAVLGVAAALYRGTGALCAVPVGRLTERVGAAWAMRAAALMAAIASAGIGLLATDVVALCGFLMLCGVANVVGQTGANLSLSRAVRPGRQGAAFGLKQCAQPLATLVAGVTVPAIALTVGWRWAFAGSALVATVVALLIPSSRDVRFEATSEVADLPIVALPLVVLAAGVMCAMAAATSLTAFTVDAAVASGIRPGPAGLLLTLGSACAVAVRLTAGLLADRRDGGHLTVVAWLVGLGAAGFLLMSLSRPWALSVGVLIAFGLGWGFNGLFWFAIVRFHRGAPARATGLVMPGGMIGGVVGPIAFGWIVERSGYGVGWMTAGSWALLGAVITLIGGRMLRAHVRRSEFREDIPGGNA